MVFTTIKEQESDSLNINASLVLKNMETEENVKLIIEEKGYKRQKYNYFDNRSDDYLTRGKNIIGLSYLIKPVTEDINLYFCVEEEWNLYLCS